MDWENILKKEINWLDAFDKFGFDDGYENEGYTDEVVDFLEKEGYRVHMTFASGHNEYIPQIDDSEGNRVYPKDEKRTRYATRDKFPTELLKLLDAKFGKSMKSEGIKS